MPRTLLPNVVLPSLAVAGLALGVAVVMAGARPPAVSKPIDPPAGSAFASAVAGVGMVEPGSEFIQVGTEVAGVVTDVPVVAGATVHVGDVLFVLDERAARAELAVRESELALAESTLAKLRASPRVEEIPPHEARVAAAEALLREARSMLQLVEQVGDAQATSPDEVARRRFQVEHRTAALEEAKSSLALARAGAWGQEVAVAEAECGTARSRVEAARTAIALRTVRSPIDGSVMRVDVRPGEFVQAGGGSPMVLGRTDSLLVRVDVDETEAWRVREGAKAMASLRGNSAERCELTFVRIEPYVVPKRSLTGLSTERVDTRVLQVIYRFEAGALRAFPGQQVDVFIEAAARGDAHATKAVDGRP